MIGKAGGNLGAFPPPLGSRAREEGNGGNAMTLRPNWTLTPAPSPQGEGEKSTRGATSAQTVERSQ